MEKGLKVQAGQGENPDFQVLRFVSGNNRSKDEPVEELESLKHALGNIPKQLEPAKQISVSKSRTSVFSDINGRRTGLKETQQQVNKDGELLVKLLQKTETTQDKDQPAKSKTDTEVDIPSKGFRKTFHNEGEGDSTEQDEVMAELDPVMDKINALAGISYSPLDMAEYVFWTGDEKGVTLAIEDFLQEGLLTREDAINFLQAIKNNLDYIKAHYQGLRKMEEKIARKLQDQISLENENPNASYEDKVRNSILDAIKSKPTHYGKQFLKAKERGDNEEKQKRTQRVSDNEEYEEMLDRLKGADVLYNDYTLEEVIYELAKVMFSQSLTQGSKQAHTALRRFTDYLEKEVAYGQISRELERKILAVLIAALTDTISERPELLSAASEGLSNIGNQEPSSESTAHIVERRSEPKFEVEKSAKQLRQGKTVHQE